MAFFSNLPPAISAWRCLLLGFLSCLAALVCGPATAKDLPGVLTHISIEPPIYYGHQGDRLSIEVRMYQKKTYFLPGLYRISFTLKYSEESLTFLGAASGGFLAAGDHDIDTSVTAMDHQGEVEVALERNPKGNGAYGDAPLVYLNFLVKKAAKIGDFLLIIHDARFLEVTGDFIPGLTRSGQFVVRAAVSDETAKPMPDEDHVHEHGHHHEHLIPAVPNWLFWSAAAATIVITFVMTLMFVRPERPNAPYPTYDLLTHLPWLRRIIASPSSRLIFFVPAGLFVLVTMSAGILGPQTPDNVAPYLTWSIWWVFIIFVVALIGNIGGTACPWENISFWVIRRLPRTRLLGRRGLSLEKPWPKRLNNVWLAALFFVGFIWLNIATQLSVSAIWTVCFWGFMLLMTSAGMLIFERASWCRYGCPFGRVFGLYSMFAAVEIRARDREICSGCTTVDCYNGNDRGYGCPTFLSLNTLDSNRYCIGCLECVRTCPYENVTINLRPPGAEFFRPLAADIDEGILVILSLYAISIHALTLTPAWAPVSAFLVQIFISGGILLTRTIEIFAALPLFFGFFFLSAWLSAVLGGRATERRKVMLVFVYCLLPIALSYHMAHNLGHMASDLPEFLRLVGKSLSMNWQIPEPLFDVRTVWYGATTFIILGHVIAVYLSHKTAVWLFEDRRSVIMSQLPVLGVMVGYTLFSLWLITQPLLEAGLL